MRKQQQEMNWRYHSHRDIQAQRVNSSSSKSFSSSSFVFSNTSSPSSATISMNSVNDDNKNACPRTKKRWPSISRPLRSFRHRRHRTTDHSSSTCSSSMLSLSSSFSLSQPFLFDSSMKRNETEAAESDVAAYEKRILRDGNSSAVSNENDNEGNGNRIVNQSIESLENDDNCKVVETGQLISLADDTNNNDAHGDHHVSHGETCAVNTTEQEIVEIDDNEKHNRQERERQKEWSCPRCTLLNRVGLSQCEACQFCSESASSMASTIRRGNDSSHFQDMVIQVSDPTRTESLNDDYDGIIPIGVPITSSHTSNGNCSRNNSTRTLVGEGALEGAVHGEAEDALVSGVPRDCNNDNNNLDYSSDSRSIAPYHNYPTTMSLESYPTATSTTRSIASDAQPTLDQLFPSITIRTRSTPTRPSRSNNYDTTMLQSYTPPSDRHDTMFYGPPTRRQTNDEVISSSSSSSNNHYASSQHQQHLTSQRNSLVAPASNEIYRYGAHTTPSFGFYDSEYEETLNAANDGEGRYVVDMLLGASANVAYNYLRNPTIHNRGAEPQVMGATIPPSFLNSQSSRVQRHLEYQHQQYQQYQHQQQLRNNLDGMSYDQLLEVFGDGNENIRGVPTSIINSLPECTINNVRKDLPVDKRRCLICLEDFNNGDSKRILPCLHGFHTACVDRWLRTHGLCPICKYAI